MAEIAASVDVHAGGYTVTASGASPVDVARTLYGVVMLLEDEVWPERRCTGSHCTCSGSPGRPDGQDHLSPVPTSGD